MYCSLLAMNLTIHSSCNKKIILYISIALALLILGSMKLQLAGQIKRERSDIDWERNVAAEAAEHIIIAIANAGTEHHQGHTQRIVEKGWTVDISSNTNGRKLLSAAATTDLEESRSILHRSGTKRASLRKRRRRANLQVNAVQNSRRKQQRLDGVAAAAKDVDDRASFHVDYSGPKTHPPKNN